VEEAERIEAIVNTQVARMPASRRAALQPLLVMPYSEMRTSHYYADPKRCWVVAASGATLLCFCPGGGVGNDPWAFLSPSDRDLGMDGQWFPSLDDAFINSGLCHRSLIPPGYEAP
jgi:hypothetical protein